MNTWLLLFILATQFVFIGFAVVFWYILTKMACGRFGRQESAIADLRDQLDALAREA